jgi:hypothetical protein
MSAGNLQEMESTSKTKQSMTAVNADARPADPMHSSSAFVSATPDQSITDLGGPTPYNYRPNDDSAKYAAPAIKTVRDVVNAKAVKAEELEYEEDLLEAQSEEDDDTSEEDEDQESGKNHGKKKMKKSMDEEVEEDDEEFEEYAEESEDDEEELEFDVTEDISALFGDEVLSEEFKERAALVFESALRSKVAEAASIIENRYEKALEENVSLIQEELTQRVDSYLEYVSSEWLEENALQVERGLKTELSESFMSNLKTLFEEHYVAIPEDKYDVLENMVNKLDEMESRLNEQIEKNIQLNQRLSESVSDGILYDVSRGLAETQKSKLAVLSESVEFISEEDYREKLEALRESYFPRNPISQELENELSESDSESVSGAMEAYLKAVTKFSK